MKCATVHGGALQLEQVRAPRENPGQQPLDLARLLWREEALAVLEQHQAACGVRGRARLEFYRRLVEVLTVGELRAAVVEKFRTRHASGLWK